MLPLKVAYTGGRELHIQCSKLKQIRSRGSMVNELIKAYGLTSYLNIISSKGASEEELLSFHSKEYIDHLKHVTNCHDIEKVEDNDEFGLGYDCPILDNIYPFVSAVVGGSLAAADELIKGSAVRAINWYGGWHHAQRDEAEGFCYVNDIVCAIQRLRKKFNKVLYIDLDIHHGNGVQNAFEFTQKVLTLSFHKYETGFYPGTGALDDVGKGNGLFYTVNVPLKSGIRDEPYCSLFDSVAGAVFRKFCPDAIVTQCGADSLNSDPLGSFNLTPAGMGHCVKTILSWNLPTLFVGGGGYNLPNVARCWTYLTSIITGCDIPTDIPEHPFFSYYGPDFNLEITPGNRLDENSQQYLQNIKTVILGNVDKIS